MTRKHYVGLAIALRISGADQKTIAAIADYLASDNRAFDRERFIKACTA